MLMLLLMLMLCMELRFVCCEKCTKQIITLPFKMQTFSIQQQMVNITAAGICMVQTHVILNQLRHKTRCVQCMAFSPQRPTALSAMQLE